MNLESNTLIIISSNYYWNHFKLYVTPSHIFISCDLFYVNCRPVLFNYCDIILYCILFILHFMEVQKNK